MDELASRPAPRPRGLSREAFERLLNVLGPEREAAGRHYESLRRRLIDLCAWEKCEFPEELADEILNRLARKLAEGSAIEDPDRYAFGIARMVVRESVRWRRNKDSALEAMRLLASSDVKEPAILSAMKECLADLPDEVREVILGYYLDDRAALARELGISLNALRNRAMRIREKLFACVMRRRDIL